MSESSIINKKLAFRKNLDNEPEWLFEKRKNGWHQYNIQPMPDRVSHLWRYSDPAKYLAPNPSVSTGFPILRMSSYGDNHKYDITARLDGDREATFLVDPKLSDDGVIFSELNNAVTNSCALVNKFLGILIGNEFGKLESINMALWNAGALLYVPDNTILEKPIYLKRTFEAGSYYHRLLVIAGANSSFSLIDDLGSNDANAVTTLNNVTEVFLGNSAKAELVSIQNLNQKSNSYITQRASTGTDAEFRQGLISVGSKNSKLDIGTVLNGRGSNSNIYGVAIGNGNQHHDHHTLHHHAVSDSLSDIDFKVVLKENAISAYTGLIRIDQDAKNCQAFQENRNLLLDKGTRAESIPELEILNEQVQCSHGATVGPIDPAMVYYLTSRGIPRNEAVGLIVNGFMEKTLNKLSETVHEEVSGLIKTKLEA